MHYYGNYNKSIFDDEDFVQDIQLHFTEIAKKGYIWAWETVMSIMMSLSTRKNSWHIGKTTKKVILHLQQQ